MEFSHFIFGDGGMAEWPVQVEMRVPPSLYPQAIALFGWHGDVREFRVLSPIMLDLKPLHLFWCTETAYDKKWIGHCLYL